METGEIGRQANGAIMATMGDTVRSASWCYSQIEVRRLAVHMVTSRKLAVQPAAGNAAARWPAWECHKMPAVSPKGSSIAAAAVATGPVADMQLHRALMRISACSSRFNTR